MEDHIIVPRDLLVVEHMMVDHTHSVVIVQPRVFHMMVDVDLRVVLELLVLHLMVDNPLRVSRDLLLVVHMMVGIDLRVVRDLLVIVPLDVDQPLPQVVDLFFFDSRLVFSF